MQTVNPGDSITFEKHFYDSTGTSVDPPWVTFRVYRTVTNNTFGPHYYDSGNGDVNRIGTGHYSMEINIHGQLMPGIYTSEWQAVIDGEDVYVRSEFQVLEILPEGSGGILDAPVVYGVMRPSPRFNDMGLGLTSQLCIVGHCSGLTLNEPYQVHDIQEAINVIGANQYSPMVRYLLEAYNAGARDIWIMPSAPESEFVLWDPANQSSRMTPIPELSGQTFYERYYDRYLETLSYLEEWEFPDIVVAPDAPLRGAGDIDFLTPLKDHCNNGFVNTGRFRFGFIGTLYGNNPVEESIQDLISYQPLQELGEDGKTILATFGEATINVSSLQSTYVSNIAMVAAATTTTLPYDRGLTYMNLPGVVAPTHRNLTKKEVSTLSMEKVNPLVRTSRGKRGTPFNAVLATDNLVAADGSDYWALVQMRLVQEVIKVVRAYGENSLGTVKLDPLRRQISDYLTNLVLNNIMRDYGLSVYRNPQDLYTVLVNISLRPYYGIREIAFTVEVGAGTAAENPLLNV